MSAIMDIGKFVGVVTDILGEHNFTFQSDNNIKCQIGQVVGLCVSERLFALARINKIDVNYFLTNSEEYFTSIASDNKLNELANGSRIPKYSQRIEANFIGLYEYNGNTNYFIESYASINSYTPYIFQPVLSFSFPQIETAYGLNQTTGISVKLGIFLYPNYSCNNDYLPEVNVSLETLYGHSLISGVTGSGKSRLTALLANQLAANDGHITIIDPHNEYANLVDTNNAEVYFFSNNKYYERHSNKVRIPCFLFPDNVERRVEIKRRGLTLLNRHIDLNALMEFLPNLTETQREYLYEAYAAGRLKDKNKGIALHDLVNATILKFNSDYEADGYPLDILLKAQVHAKEDAHYPSFLNRFVSFLNKELPSGKYKAGKTEVGLALLRRFNEIHKDGSFDSSSRESNEMSTPAWLDYNHRKVINIINVIYDSNPYLMRFVNTIIQYFFTPQENRRVLIVDEAHLILREIEDTAKLLSRLLRESRKYNLSIIFITQNETDVPEDIRSQFQNRFRFREDANEQLKYLDNQTCICSLYKGKLMFPMKVDNVDETK